VQACYERELRSRPSLAGRVSMQVRITVAGGVTDVRATANTTGSDTLAVCIADVLGRMSFSQGPTGGPATYTFPFDFHPQVTP